MQSYAMIQRTMKRTHLAILKRPYLNAVIDHSKTIEMRLTKTRTVPFGRITKGDRLYLKASAGPILATATVARVLEKQNLTPKRIAALQNRYNKHICAPPAHWAAKADCKYACLIWLKDVIPMTTPRNIQKRDQRPWVILTKEENFNLPMPSNNPPNRTTTAPTDS